jgi:flagellar basal body rod protein FlgC
MTSAIAVGVSGFNAASDRIRTSAANLANQYSTSQVKDGERIDEPYVPQKVEATSQASGGVTTRTVDKSPATIRTPNGDGTTTELPNVDTAEELIEMKFASYDAKANLATIRVQNNMQQSLLDIFV